MTYDEGRDVRFEGEIGTAAATEPVTLRLPVRRDTPSSSDTRLWLPVVKPSALSRPSAGPASSPSASDPAPLNVTRSRSAGAGLRRKDPEAGRYSIIAADRGKRRATG
jgi:hypothetical protein